MPGNICRDRIEQPLRVREDQCDLLDNDLIRNDAPPVEMEKEGGKDVDED